MHIGEGTPGEVVVIRMHGAVAAHPASVIRPLLLRGPCCDLVARQGAQQPGCRRTGTAGTAPGDRRGVSAPPAGGPEARARDYTPGDTDLSWTRLTPWRALLAAALDQYPAKIKSVAVEAERGNPLRRPARRLVAFRLKVEVIREISSGPGMTMTTASGDIAITRPDGLLASYAVPVANGSSLSSVGTSPS